MVSSRVVDLFGFVFICVDLLCFVTLLVVFCVVIILLVHPV